MSELLKLEELPGYLKDKDADYFKILFDSIDEIKRKEYVGDTSLVGGVFLITEEDGVVNQFHNICYELRLVVVFDWMNWEVGIDMLDDNNATLEGLSIIDYCKLITVALRGHRLSEGYLVRLFKEGRILKLLLGMKTALET